MNFYDLAYSSGLAAASPVWLAKSAARRKVLAALRRRMGQVKPRAGQNPAILIHAVSVGEMNATRSLVTELEQARPDLDFIISATTETGFHRGLQLYGDHPRARIIRYPLDFSQAIERVLHRLRPTAVALMELEVWPNFLRHCRRERIPVVLLNGRLTDKSFANYRRFRPLIRGMFRQLSHICAQEEVYARRFIELGADPSRVEVMGTMKFDTAPLEGPVAGDQELAAAVGLRPGDEPIWVCGSTGPGEEAIVLDAYRQLLKAFPRLRLVMSPRKPERFDEAAHLIESRGYPLIRRSEVRDSHSRNPEAKTQNPPVVLGDTMGELRKFYSVADVVFVGRTLVDLGERQHGSDMIEPAALGKPVVVGPYTGNFAGPMRCFQSAGAMRIIERPDELAGALQPWLERRAEGMELGRRAREVVRAQRGATQRQARVLLELIGNSIHPRDAHPVSSRE